MGCPVSNNECRFKCYHLLSRSTHGIIGRGDQREFPHCVVDQICAIYPNQNGVSYVGFKKPLRFSYL